MRLRRGLEDELQVCVESSEAMMRRRGLSKEQPALSSSLHDSAGCREQTLRLPEPHGVTLVAEGRLHTEEDISEMLASERLSHKPPSTGPEHETERYPKVVLS